MLSLLPQLIPNRSLVGVLELTPAVRQECTLDRCCLSQATHTTHTYTEVQFGVSKQLKAHMLGLGRKLEKTLTGMKTILKLLMENPHFKS